VDFIKAILLGIVEGFTEFLPISSTGHLILVEQYLELGEGDAFKNALTVIIQLPAILAVVLLFWKDMWPFQGAKTPKIFRLWVTVAIAFLPAAVLGFLLDDFIEAHLLSPVPVAIALVVGGLILLVIERKPRTPAVYEVHDIDWKRALAIGFFQCLAMLPGTSRSGATIVGGMLLGASRSAAAEFSFFLAVPTMLGATTLKLLKTGFDFTPHQWALLGVSSVVSFITAYAVVALFMAYIRRRTFTIFGWYRIVLGLIVLAAYSLV